MKKFLSGLAAGIISVAAFQALAFTFTNTNTPSSYSTGDVRRVCFDADKAEIWVNNPSGEPAGKLTVTKDGSGGTMCQLQGEVTANNSADCSGVSEAALQARIDSAFNQGVLGLQATGVAQ